MKFFICVLVSFISLPLFAHSFDSDSSFGSNQFAQSFTYSGNSTPDQNKLKVLWSAGFDYAQNSTTDSSSNEITNHTYGGRVGIGFKKDWLAGFSFSYALTKEESLHEIGPSIYVGYTFKLPNSSDDFARSISIRGSLGLNRFIQKYSRTVRRRAGASARTSGSNSIDQRIPAVSVHANLVSWASFGAKYSFSNYSKDVNTFLTQLDSTRSILSGSSNFSSTLSSFGDHLIEPSVSLYPTDFLEFETSAEFARLVSNQHWETLLKFRSVWDISSFSLGASYQRGFLDTSTSNTFGASFGYLF